MWKPIIYIVSSRLGEITTLNSIRLNNFGGYKLIYTDH